MTTASGVKTSHREKTIIKEKESILVYAKNKTEVYINPQYIPKEDWLPFVADRATGKLYTL